MLNRAWRRALLALKTAVALATVVTCITTIATPAFAGTTGVVNGYVTDSSHAPVTDVTVTFRSPSGSYSTTTNSKGFYSIAGLYADTYTVSFVKSGYDSQVFTGISVFADQTVPVNATLGKSLQTIAHVTARSSASAFQPTQTADTYTVNATQIQNIQGSDFNYSESNLIASLPGAEYDSSGYPVIHGGRENEEGFEFEGIPYTDAFTNQFINALALPGPGLASAQLTPGAGDASVQSNGTGVLNLTAQRGTYPGYAMPEFSVGGPGYYHAFNGSLSYASANGRFSNYAAFSGDNIAPQLADGLYPAAEINQSNALGQETDREFLDNMIFRFGKNNNQSVQFFADIAQHNFYDDYGGLGGWCFESCNPYVNNLYGPIYGFSPSQVATLTGLYPGQTSLTETLASANRSPETYYEPNESYKFQYNLNINSSTYLMADIYRVNSVTTFDFVNTGANCCGYGDQYLDQGGQRTGGKISLEKQLNDKNLLEVGYEYAWLHPVYQENSYGDGWLAYLEALEEGEGNGAAPYDFIPSGDCPSAAEAEFGTTCGSANPTGAQEQLPGFNEMSNINRRDADYYLNDKINFSEKLNASVGVRVETADYVGMPTPGLDASTCTFLYDPTSVTINPQGSACPYTPNYSGATTDTSPSEVEPRLGLSWQFAKDSSVRVTFDRTTTFPILGLVDNVVGTSPSGNVYSAYDKYSADAGSACGIAPYTVTCNNLGEELYWTMQNFEGVPYQMYQPMVANNYQITLQHQFTSGFLNGVAVSLAPWATHQYNTEASVAEPIIQSNGQVLVENGTVVNGPAVATNLGEEYATGIDLNVTKENPVGLSGQWTASYINEFSSVIPTSPLEDFFPSIPYSSAAAGDVYRVGFISPFQTTLGLTWKTASGIRINPRFTYDIGYPIGEGTITAATVNGKSINVPNTNAVSGSASSASGVGYPYYVDPMNPGSVIDPNIDASNGFTQGASAGSKLTPPNFNGAITLEYAPPHANYKIGFDVENLFNRIYFPSGAGFNPYFQPVATGIGGPLTGYTNNATSYSVPYAQTQILSQFGGNGVFVNEPDEEGRNYYAYYSVRI